VVRPPYYPHARIPDLEEAALMDALLVVAVVFTGIQSARLITQPARRNK
jgi:hypothetical protein